MTDNYEGGQDLRGFLEYLKSKKELVTVTKSVSVKHEIAAFIRESCDDRDAGPAFMFTNIKEYPKQRVCGGVYGSARRIGMAVGFSQRVELSPQESVYWYSTFLENYRRGKQDYEEWGEVASAGACQEVIESPRYLDRMPICTYHERDAGPFITSGIQVVRDNVHGTLGVGIHRMLKCGPTQLGCLAPIERRVGKPYFEASSCNKPMPIAIIIGGAPADMLASQAKIPHTDEKYAMTRELLSGTKPIKLTLVKCKTSELLVPACAEYIIEGHSIPNSGVDDTPFGEYCGTSSMRSNAWLVEVDCITHRVNPIFPALLTGMPPQEDSNLCAVPTSAFVYQDARATGTLVQAVSVYLGNNVFDAVISIKKRSNSEVHNLLYRILGNNYVKSVTVVDSDIDPNDAEDVRWAMNTRMQPDRDIVITGKMYGASLDPSSSLFRSTSKIGYDCTVPIGNTDDETHENWRRHSKVHVPDAII